MKEYGYWICPICGKEIYYEYEEWEDFSRQNSAKEEAILEHLAHHHGLYSRRDMYKVFEERVKNAVIQYIKRQKGDTVTVKIARIYREMGLPSPARVGRFYATIAKRAIDEIMKELERKGIIVEWFRLKRLGSNEWLWRARIARVHRCEIPQALQLNVIKQRVEVTL